METTQAHQNIKTVMALAANSQHTVYIQVSQRTGAITTQRTGDTFGD